MQFSIESYERYVGIFISFFLMIHDLNVLGKVLFIHVHVSPKSTEFEAIR